MMCGNQREMDEWPTSYIRQPNSLHRELPRGRSLPHKCRCGKVTAGTFGVDPWSIKVTVMVLKNGLKNVSPELG